MVNGCPKAAEHLWTRTATLDSLFGAAASGHLDAARNLITRSNKVERDGALLVATQCDRMPVAEFLRNSGADSAAYNGMTALHWAAANGNIAVIDLLLSHGALLEAENEYGGSVLSSTIWFAYHARSADFARRNFPAVFDKLIAAGARTDRYNEMQQDMERLRQRANS